MILPSLNTLNCGNLLRAGNTILSSNEIAHRKNVPDWTIRSQASLKEDEGSTTRKSNLTHFGMVKFPRAGWLLLLTILLLSTLPFMVEASMARKVGNLQIDNTIVGFDSVNMVDDFTRVKESPNMMLHDKTMLRNVSFAVAHGMFNIANQTISIMGRDKTGMKRINNRNIVIPSNIVNLLTSSTENFRYLSGSHVGVSHFSNDFNRKLYSLGSLNGKFVHIDHDKFFANSIENSKFVHRLQSSVVFGQLLFGDKEFLFHDYSISPYLPICQELISRYSLDYCESNRREDKELLDNTLEIKKQGDKVYIRTVPDVTIFAHQKGMVLPKQRPESPDVEMLIDKAHGWNILLDDVDKVQSDIDLLNKFTGDAAKQLDIEVDSSLLGAVYADANAYNCGATAGKVTAGYNLGATGAPVQVTKVNIIDYIVACGGVLDENDVPDENRWMVIPSWMAVMLKSSDLKDASLSGDPKSILRSGLLGMIDRFMIYQSNNIGSVAAATETSGFKSYYVLFGNKDAISFANQFTKTETLRSSESFDTIVRGLMVWGYKTVKSEALGYLYARK